MSEINIPIQTKFPSWLPLQLEVDYKRDSAKVTKVLESVETLGQAFVAIDYVILFCKKYSFQDLSKVVKPWEEYFINKFNLE